jgi:hypothetical protein
VSQADVKLFFESFCGEVSLHGVPYFRPCLKISCYGVSPVRAVWKRTFVAEPQTSWQFYGNCLEMECAGCTTKIAGGLPSFYTNHIYRVCDGLFIFSHQWPTSCHLPKTEGKSISRNLHSITGPLCLQDVYLNCAKFRSHYNTIMPVLSHFM